VAYRIVFTREARAHFARKRLRPNSLATWRLRVGDLRVYYEVIEGREPTVLLKAIGLKVRERVLIGGEEIDLS